MAMSECSACGFPSLRPEGHAAFCAAVLAAWDESTCAAADCDRPRGVGDLCVHHAPTPSQPSPSAAPPAPGVSPGSPGAGLVVDDERQKDDSSPSGSVASLPGVATSAVWPPVV